MKQVRLLDRTNLMATFEAGLRGPMRSSIWPNKASPSVTFPNSIDLSTVGGWVATRSAGQFSTAYGNIEDMVLDLEVVLLRGGSCHETDPAVLHRPRLKNVFIGSEGTLGVISAVTFSVRWKPEKRDVSAFYTQIWTGVSNFSAISSRATGGHPSCDNTIGGR